MANKLKIKKGDLVQVIAGARQSRGGDRGKQGKVLAVYPERNRVLVEGVNRVIKHKKATQTQAGGTAGGRETHEAPSMCPTWRSLIPRTTSDPRGIPRGEGGARRPHQDRSRPLLASHRGGDLMTETSTNRPAPRLKQVYRDEIVGKLQDEFDYANPMQVPGLTKVVVNMGVGDAARDSKLIEGAINDLTLITGQKPVVTRAKKSIAQFKLREGQPIGAHVTMRGARMWEFVDRVISLALPRIRDFRGLSDRQFDGNGNYTFGLTEQSMFHEIDQDRIDRVRGMDITVVTTAKTDDEGRALLRHLGFPFKTK